MPSAPYKPSQIYVDAAAADLPLTRRILQKFPDVPAEIVEDPKALKKPAELTDSKRKLLLARMKADPLKPFPAQAQSCNRPYFSLDLISNCHLECTYCILQSYLANNPVLTIFTNIEEILSRLKTQLEQIPPGSILGTGRIADSLALDPLSEHTRWLIPFMATQTQAFLELKTKSDRIENLLGLSHNERTIVAWSLNTPEIIGREELKTASLEERLGAARRAAEEGYPVAFHLDPLVIHSGWKKNYNQMVERLFDLIRPERIAWISIGALRFPHRQRRTIKTRFPKQTGLLQGLISTHRSFVHYPDQTRKELQSWVETQIARFLPPQKIYRCMDFT